MSYYSPHTHLALARARQEDLIREARRRELARLVPKDEGPSLLARLAARLRRREAPRPVATSA
ncbi:MAG: hypothetical protein ACRDNC_00735 [Gaiellaceae bacterium]|jgi:hypothetical protein